MWKYTLDSSKPNEDSAMNSTRRVYRPPSFKGIHLLALSLEWTGLRGPRSRRGSGFQPRYLKTRGPGFQITTRSRSWEILRDAALLAYIVWRATTQVVLSHRK
ncbi:hypothetical protein JOB18_040040 [Solea senegalensis]|uniref:Uncharacterized protein n=1 Tax=Solea senegalensis TaxID=28829 RepID=A0AAV6R7D1_SOLSE|nr:hypothetical protein JOB18_040040 [Solea senegalensis]